MNEEIMIRVKVLEKLTVEEYHSLGETGYGSDAVYDIERSGDGQHFSFSFSLRKLENPFQKKRSASAEDLEDYNLIIAQGHSLGAYRQEQLVGVLIAEERTWNNSLWIDYLEVNAEFHRLGFGAALISKVIEQARKDKFRLIMLETQNTNVPAILFYRRQGFEIDGLQFSLYDGEPGEQAVFMTYMLEP